LQNRPRRHDPYNGRVRHLLADGWRSLGPAPVWGRVCARHLGAGATSVGLHAATVLSILSILRLLASVVGPGAGAPGVATKQVRPLVLFSAAPSANTNASAQNERPSAKPLLQAGKDSGPAKVGIEAKQGDSTPAFPGFTFDAAKLPFQRIRALAAEHNPDIGQVPVLLREYVNQNVLQPYVETRLRDPRLWTQLGLAADHEIFVDYITDYVSRHPGTKGSIEMLFMLDILVQSSLDTLQVLLEIDPDRDLRWTRQTSPAAFNTIVKIRDYYLAQRARLGLDSYRALERHYDQLRTQILTAIMRTAPDDYRVDDARYLLGAIHWHRGRSAEAKRIWGQLPGDPHGHYARTCASLLLAMRDAESRRRTAPVDPRRRGGAARSGDDDLEDRAIGAILEAEYQQWLSASRTRLHQFGYVVDAF
jgi:hypothetical protein